MFTIRCDCLTEIDVAAANLNVPLHCPECGREIVCVCAEALKDSTATDTPIDFRAGLLVVAGATREAQLIKLGGSFSITVGSSADSHIVLAGEGVAAEHCELVPVGADGARWRIEDLSNGASLLVNRETTVAAELKPGDTIQIGEYELIFQLMPPTGRRFTATPDKALASRSAKMGRGTLAGRGAAGIGQPGQGRPGKTKPAKVPTGEPVICPSCQRKLASDARICVDCGIRVPSGRPLLLSRGFDEDVVQETAETAARIVSWVVFVTPLPIPLASKAYGKTRPIAIWVIAALTLLVTLGFLVSRQRGEASDNPESDAHIPPKRGLALSQQLMLWPMRPDYRKYVDREWGELVKAHRTGETIQNMQDPRYSDEKYRAQIEKEAREHPFHPWQLATYPLVHDADAPMSSLRTVLTVLYLAGNLLFLFVFGSRVNAIIGNLATAIIYPILAAAAGLTFLFMISPDRVTPLIGATGAISGLAGIYIVLLPSHNVYCAMWFRFLWLSFLLRVFVLRGISLLLIYLAYELVMIALNTQSFAVHWANVGGFVTGVVIGFALLLSRRFNCRNSDLLSLLLGRHAWPLIGKPSRWDEAGAAEA